MSGMIFGGGLDSRVAVYVPSTIHAAAAPAPLVASMVEEVASGLASLFGGATATAGRGAWYSEDLGKMIFEDVTIVYAFTTAEALEQAAEKIRAICEHVRDVMKQEAVSLEVNNALHFI